ncbi:MAG: hypothetical protein EOS82_10985 [Mesorhizobium sp.]|nr:MAG: hypothetical protein EOR89_17120 [Mesorhizobium sp.]RWQ52509.1 MAG: hypothetical protein EOS82_10985 [Mesorhizobium sp.]
MKAVPSRSFGPPSVLPDISPTGGEIRLSLQLSPIPNVAERAPAAKLPISPLVGEMSGRTEGALSDVKVLHRMP